MRTLHCQVPSRMRRACASQSGSTMLLGIGVGAVVLALILILATATAIYLDLKRLTYLADNCVALAAREVGSEGQVDALAAQKTASSCVAQQGSDPNGPLAGSRLSSVSLSGLSVQGDKVQVQVQLSARSSPALIPWGLLPASGFNLHTNASSHLSLLQ